LLWGLAWSGIWVGGNTIILDISDSHSRGRWVGIYQISFFLGASTGAIAGGFLTDRLGYHPAMAIGAGLTLLGAVMALLLLPETRPLSRSNAGLDERAASEPVGAGASHHRAEFASVLALLGVNRLVVAGIFMSTFGLLLLERVGNVVKVGGFIIGIATLTGLGLGANSLMAMVAAPLLGGLSDRLDSRWQVAAGGLGSGVAGLSLLAVGLPWSIMLGLPLTAVAGGGNQGLSTALVGDLSGNRRQGRQLGILFTTGDLASAVGPLLAYSLLVRLGLAGLYLASSGLFAIMFLIAWYWATALKTEHDVTIN
jgi:MFS family permease